jgi:ribosomal protein L19
MNNDILKLVEKKNRAELVEKQKLTAEPPQFDIGDTVDVHTRILEGEKERIQIFSGVVIARSGSGSREMFTVRRIVANDLRPRELRKSKVLATVIQLLERTFIRIGNEEYVRANGSFGLTTLRDKHVRIRGQEICFEFKGKSGIKHSSKLSDARLARIVKGCQELPGQELFQYLGDDGRQAELVERLVQVGELVVGKG